MSSLPATVRSVVRPAAARRAGSGADWTGSTTVLMTVGLVGGIAVLLALVPIGSGDYGQWLMASRYYAGLPEPAYRSIGDVPPFVPWSLAAIRAVVPDPVAALHLMSIALLVLLATGFALAAATLFESRMAGFLAAALALVATDQFLGLFAFGGLLQVAAVAFTTLAIAAFWRAGRPGSHAWAFWSLGSLALVLAALSHLATGAMALVVGVAVALLSVLRASDGWRQRFRALAPLAISLGAVAIWWVAVLLPGSAAYVSNPASLNYRGPDRLLETFIAYSPTLGLMAVAAVAILAGAAREARRHAIGPFTAVGAWGALTLALLAFSILASAATDYPRFTTPVLAPLVVGAAGGLLAAARWTARLVHRTPVRPRVAGVVAAALVVMLGAPLAMGTYAEAARGYALADPTGLSAASAWIAANVPQDATVLAPVREGKWVEGLTGRAALFDNSVRYSFRPAEWERSLAARVLLQSTCGIANQFFLLRYVGGSPCGAGLTPDSVAIAANHAGEFVDLLELRAADTRLTAGTTLVATVGNLHAAPMDSPATAGGSVTATGAWTGSRQGAAIAFHQRITASAGQSAMEVVSVATSDLPLDGMQVELHPAAGVAVTGLQVQGSVAEVTFTQLGRSQPRLRLAVAGPGGSISRAPDGGLLVMVPDRQLRLLITDLTASAEPIAGLQVLSPAALARQYDIGAAVVRRDGAFPSRAARLAAIGLTVEHDFGGYAVLTPP